MPEYERERRVYTERDADATRRVDPVDPDLVDRRGRGYRQVEHEYVREESPRDIYFRRRIIYNRIANVVWSIIGFIEALIGLRILLRLIAANAGNGFVRSIYDFSGVFVDPFLGIVNDIRSGNSVLEINALIAMLVYLLIGYGVVRLIWLIFDTTAPTEA